MKHRFTIDRFTIDRGHAPVGGTYVVLIKRDDGAEWRAWVCRYEGRLQSIHRLRSNRAGTPRAVRTPLKPGSANFRFFAKLLNA